MCDVNEIIGPVAADLMTWASMITDDMDADLCVMMASMAGAPMGLSTAFCSKNLNIMCEVIYELCLNSLNNTFLSLNVINQPVPHLVIRNQISLMQMDCFLVI
jgi:hypothetical protein